MADQRTVPTRILLIVGKLLGLFLVVVVLYFMTHISFVALDCTHHLPRAFYKPLLWLSGAGVLSLGLVL